MTEKEFMRQIWRPLDTVTVDGGIKGRVISVSFATKSVKVQVSKEVHEWFKYDLIDEHQSIKGLPDDDAIIEDLHNKLMAANKRNDDQQKIIDDYKKKMEDLKQRAATSSVATLRKQVNVLIADLVVKKKLIESIESATTRINDVLDRIEEG